MRTQEVIFGLAGQSFFYDVPEGRPSSPAVTVYPYSSDDDGTTESATTGSCSVDSVNTTIVADVSAGSNTITVDDATGLARGRSYLLVGDDGRSELVEVAAFAGTDVVLRQPLINAYAADATFQGCRITVAVNSTWVSTKSKVTDVLDSTWRTTIVNQPDWSPGAAGYRLRWTYTVDSVARLGVSFADLVRYQAKNLVTPLDVDRRFPGFFDRLPTDYRPDQGSTLIAEAFDAVKMDLLGDNQALRRIRNTEVIRDLVIARANVMASENAVLAGGSNLDAVRTAREIYDRRYDQLMREPKVPVDQTGGGASAVAERLPAWRR